MTVRKLEQFLDNPKLSENKAYIAKYMEVVVGKPVEANNPPWQKVVGPKLQKIWDQSLAQYYPTQEVPYVSGEPLPFIKHVSLKLLNQWSWKFFLKIVI